MKLYLGIVNTNPATEYLSNVHAHPRTVGAYSGCAATLNGEFWYFGGGSPVQRQVSLKLSKFEI